MRQRRTWEALAVAILEQATARGSVNRLVQIEQILHVDATKTNFNTVELAVSTVLHTR